MLVAIAVRLVKRGEVGDLGLKQGSDRQHPDRVRFTADMDFKGVADLADIDSNASISQISPMPTITIRNLEEQVKQRLRVWQPNTVARWKPRPGTSLPVKPSPGIRYAATPLPPIAANGQCLCGSPRFLEGAHEHR